MSQQIKYLILFLSFIATFIIAPGSAIARDMDFSLGTDTVTATFSDLLEGSDYGRKEYAVGMLYNRDDNYFVDAAIQIIDEAGSKFPGLEVGVGPKMYLGKTKTQDYLTFGIAALANYRMQELNRYLFSGYLYFSPSIVSFIDADQMWELHFRAGYEIIPAATAYIGFRRIRAKVNINTERTIDNEIHFGIKMDF